MHRDTGGRLACSAAGAVFLLSKHFRACLLGRQPLAAGSNSRNFQVIFSKLLWSAIAWL